MKLEQAIKSTSFVNNKQKAGLNILYTAWWLKTIMSKELKEYGLTHEQYNVLRILKGKNPEPLCVKDIASRLIEKSSNVPRIIDRLENKKLVTRTVSPADKRETLIGLTKSGIGVLEASTAKINTIFDAVLPMENNEAGVLNDLLEKFRLNEV
ncbi:MAG: MarR family transcriptional regulator [Chitinophagaceae bacterium]|nr:MarR family transcriptional regulator [Chitinophagaceae bacterium]